MRVTALLVLASLAAACATFDPTPVPTRAVDFKPSEMRQVAVFVRVTLGPGFDERERAVLPSDYEGALVAALDSRAVIARDVRLLAPREAGFEPGAAVARARDVGADSAILVETQVTRGETTFCRETRRPLRGPATLWRQHVHVLRAADGAARFGTATPVEVTDVEADCERPRESRRRDTAATVTEAVEQLLTRVLGPVRGRD